MKTFTFLRLTLVTASLLACCQASAGLREGLVAYAAADYQTARRELLPEAERGSAIAQYKIGLILRRTSDADAALVWLTRAAEQGHAGAQFEIAQGYCHWWSPGQDCERPLHWLQQSAAQDNQDAAFLLGLLYERGAQLPKNRAQSRVWLERAAQLGHRRAAALLELDNAPPGLPAALALFRTQNYVAALPVLTAAANAGDPTAQSALGDIYYVGQPPLLAEDSEQSLFWWTRAAIQGDADAQLMLATFGSDSKERLGWLEKAAQGNNTDALIRLANLYQHGQNGLRTDPVRAARYCLQAATLGSAPAQQLMGQRYLDGDGVAKDPASAAQWFLAAAKAGQAAAQARLGDLYATGQGVQRNLASARYWYGKAAAQNFLEGELGLLDSQ